jgi:hypothetical protein
MLFSLIVFVLRLLGLILEFWCHFAGDGWRMSGLDFPVACADSVYFDIHDYSTETYNAGNSRVEYFQPATQPNGESSAISSQTRQTPVA